MKRSLGISGKKIVRNLRKNKAGSCRKARELRSWTKRSSESSEPRRLWHHFRACLRPFLDVYAKVFGNLPSSYEFRGLGIGTRIGGNNDVPSDHYIALQLHKRGRCRKPVNLNGLPASIYLQTPQGAAVALPIEVVYV